jgi:hypothetical protein
MAYGTVNADVIQTSTSGGILGAGNASLMKNRIINGAMVIDQRNAGASVPLTNSGPYTIDRWGSYVSQNSIASAQQNAGSVTPPVGFTNYLGMTVSASATIGASDQFEVYQIIEGYNTADLGFGTANAKTVTLSFWVYSSLTGSNFGAYLQNYAGTRSYPFNYSVTTANTWQQVSVTIAGDTSGTWVGATNGGSLYVSFSLGQGSNYMTTGNAWATGNYHAPTGSLNIVSTNGAKLYITGVQLEVGSSATGFEYRQYGSELALCQRYYLLMGSLMGGYYGNNSSYYFGVSYSMRASPTISIQGSLSTDCLVGSAGTFTGTVTSSNYNQWGTEFYAQTTGSSGITTGTVVYARPATNNSNAGLAFSAEL